MRNHVQKPKRALVRKWLDLSGGMARKTEDLPTHRSRMKRKFAADRKTALGALFHPVVSSAGERTEIV